MQSESSTMFRCRKCRNMLDIKDSVIKSCNCLLHLTIIDLDIENCPDWIQETVNKSGWTRGRIKCGKCSARLGSFDFVRNISYQGQTECGQPSSVHLLRDRVDESNPRSLMRTPFLSVNPDRPACPKPLPLKTRLQRHTDLICDNGILCPISCDKNMEALAICDVNHNCDAATTACQLNCDEFQYRKHIQKNSNSSADGGHSLHRFTDTDRFTDIDRFLYSSITSGVREQSKLRQSDSVGSEPSTSSGGGHGLAVAIPTRNRFTLLEYDENGMPVDRESENETKPKTQRSDGSLHYDNSGNSDLRCPPIEQLEDIPPEMSCPVCLEVLFSPYKCKPCNHVFCEICLRRIAQRQPNLTLCPLCRNVIMNCTQDLDFDEEVRQKYFKQWRKRKGSLTKMKIKEFPLPRCTRREKLKQETQRRYENIIRPFRMVFRGVMSIEFVLRFILLALLLLGFVLCKLFKRRNRN